MAYTLVALKQLTHDCGVVAAGAEFVAGDIFVSQELIDRGLAEWPSLEPKAPRPPEPDPPALVYMRQAVREQLALLEADNSTTERQTE